MKKVIVENSTGRVVFILDADADVSITPVGAIGAIRALDILPETHRLQTVQDFPDAFPGCCGVDEHGQWFILDQEAWDARVKARVAEEQQRQSQEARAAILEQIAAIESRQPRAIREAVLGMEGAIDRLQVIESQIAGLRAELAGVSNG